MIRTRTAGLVAAMMPLSPVLSHGAARCPGSRHPRDAALDDPPSLTTQAAERRLFHFPDASRSAMSDRPAQRATPRKRGEGQWGLGYHEPLNTAEQIKKDDDGLNVRERIDRIFAPGGFRSIGKQDLRSPDAVVGPVHAAQAGRARRAHGLGGAGGARGRVLHDADPDRRRAHDDASSCARSRGRASGSGATSPTSPTARTSSSTGSASRTCRRSSSGIESVGLTTAGGVRRHAARVPRLPARRRHGRRGARRHTGHPRGRVALPGRPGVLEPAAQVQDVDQRLPRALHEPRDQRHLARRRRSSDARARLRPAGRRRPLDEPDVRATARRVRRARACARRLGRRVLALPRVRLPPLPQPRAVEVPGQGLGRGDASARCWRRSSSRATPLPDGPAPAPRPLAERDHVGVHEQTGRPRVRGVRAAGRARRGTPAAARRRPGRRVRRRTARRDRRSRSS